MGYFQFLQYVCGCGDSGYDHREFVSFRQGIQGDDLSRLEDCQFSTVRAQGSRDEDKGRGTGVLGFGCGMWKWIIII
jgi:hypothetical protein